MLRSGLCVKPSVEGLIVLLIDEDSYFRLWLNVCGLSSCHHLILMHRAICLLLPSSKLIKSRKRRNCIPVRRLLHRPGISIHAFMFYRPEFHQRHSGLQLCFSQQTASASPSLYFHASTSLVIFGMLLRKLAFV